MKKKPPIRLKKRARCGVTVLFWVSCGLRWKLRQAAAHEKWTCVTLLFMKLPIRLVYLLIKGAAPRMGLAHFNLWSHMNIIWREQRWNLTVLRWRGWKVKLKWRKGPRPSYWFGSALCQWGSSQVQYWCVCVCVSVLVCMCCPLSTSCAQSSLTLKTFTWNSACV